MLIRQVGGTIFLLSFLLANFFLYRKLNKEISAINEHSEISAINEHSLLIYPYINPPSYAVEMHYVGTEVAKDVDIKILYKDRNDHKRLVEITKFFPQNDTKMIWDHTNIYVLKPNQVFRFHLIPKLFTLDGKGTIIAKLTGVESGESIEIRKDFVLMENLELYLA
ncbi:hypothetical protein KAX35_01970 [candidate division WOR-3 bacterium]|nr:hypothetical protein [candidate division WOR-3 bacterium]MCK4329207.1 hypothetical protein [candidate division WOR-3 bacterium]